MPSDPYQITVSGENEISITLSDIGVATPATHASTHVTGGSDPIRLATNALSGLASAAHITTLESHTTLIATNTSDIATINSTLGGLDTGILSLSVTAPITKTGTTNPTIALPASTSSVDGYMSAAQAQKLASIATGATANSIAVTSPLTTASSGGIQTLSIPAASASGTLTNGYLSIYDKGKLDSITSGAAVSAVSVVAPLTKTTGNAPTISISAASSASRGTMSAAHYDKVEELTTNVATTSLKGYMSGTDKIKLDSLANGVSSLNVTAPVVNTGTSTVPIIGMPAATSLINGYMPATSKLALDSLIENKALNSFYAGASSGSSVPASFRAIVSADLPVVPVTKGGTGGITKAAALTNLGFRTGTATVTSGEATVTHAEITASTNVIITQQCSATETAVVDPNANIYVDWGTITNATGLVSPTAVEILPYSGEFYFAVNACDSLSEGAADALAQTTQVFTNSTGGVVSPVKITTVTSSGGFQIDPSYFGYTDVMSLLDFNLGSPAKFELPRAYGVTRSGSTRTAKLPRGRFFGLGNGSTVVMVVTESNNSSQVGAVFVFGQTSGLLTLQGTTLTVSATIASTYSQGTVYLPADKSIVISDAGHNFCAEQALTDGFSINNLLFPIVSAFSQYVNGETVGLIAGTSTATLKRVQLRTSDEATISSNADLYRIAVNVPSGGGSFKIRSSSPLTHSVNYLYTV